MSLHTRLRTFMGVATVSLLAAQLGLGCGTSASAVCDEICDCIGCSENENADCVDEIEDAERAAENEGCEDQFDEFITCFDEEIECRSSEIDADGCEAEGKSLANCMDGSVSITGGNPCEQLVNHYESCGFDVGGGGVGECTDDAAELARCLNGQSCDALQDGSAFSACAGQTDPDPPTGG